MNNQRIAIIISASVGIIATFLPFMKMFFMSVSLIESKDGFGLAIAFAFALALIVSLLGDRKKPIIKGHLAVVIVLGVIPAIILLLYALAVSSDDMMKALTIFEIGFYLVIIASLSILVLGLALRVEKLSHEAEESTRTVFCSNCGHKILDQSDEFCEECGNKL